MKNKILLCVPFALEAQNLLNHFPWQKKDGVWELETESFRWIFAVTGQGKVNTALNVSQRAHAFKPNFMCMLGSAGALAQEAPAIAWVQKTIDPDFHDIHQNALEIKRKEGEDLGVSSQFSYPSIKVIARDRSVNTAEERTLFFAEYGAQYATWESFAFLQSARFLKIPSAEIRFAVDFEKVDSLKNFKQQVLDKSKWIPEWFDKMQKVTLF